jgi:multicomponent Na+:H+ antiporter subunit A
LIAVIGVHALLAIVFLVLGDRLGRRALLLGVLGPLSALAVLMVWAAGGRAPIEEVLTWLPAMGLELGFRLDGFAALMVALVGGIGVLIFLYAWSYFGDKPRLGYFAALLVTFAGAMFGLVTADNLLVLFVFWELTSIMSYLLIGFQDESAAARSSALQALLVTGLGGLAMLGGLVMLAQAGDSYSLSTLLANPPVGATVGPALALILIGAFAKSAQFPFHFWLPGAMAAPTPVSAYLHSATMVKAGIYMVARLAPVFALSIGWWRPTLAVVGVVTMLVGGWRALGQNDLKLLLAQGTVSQLGFIMVLVGMGSPALTFAGVAMILAHSLFKGALFMIAGTIDHTMHTRDIRNLSGLRHRMPLAFRLSVVAVASMAGLPPLLGYLSKEAALEGLVGEAGWVLVGAIVLGSILTTAYGLRFLTGAFGTKSDTVEADKALVDTSDRGLLLPSSLLVGLTVLLGLVPWLAELIVEPAATSLDPATSGFHLVLWHGFGWPIALSAVALGGGWLLWRRPMPGLRSLTSRLPEASHVYAVSLGGLNRFADRTTAIVQSGSLPVYLGIILSVAVLAPGFFMARYWRGLPDLTIAESPVQALTAVIVVMAALATVRANRRLAAVLLLGGVGYGVAALFVIQGAPDLALTQLLVETLALALFVLVLSRLPARFEAFQTRIRRFTRLGVSVAVGVLTASLSLWAVSGRVAPSLAPEFLARAEPDGGGRNVVNVILTDFRALDTLGEITVLVVAAMGAIALVRARLPKDEGAEAPGGDM